jgi:hypothetical protein
VGGGGCWKAALGAGGSAATFSISVANSWYVGGKLSICSLCFNLVHDNLWRRTQVTSTTITKIWHCSNVEEVKSLGEEVRQQLL